MDNSNFKIGQLVSYTNGSLCVYSGIIVKVTNRPTLIVVNDAASFELWNAGCAIGDEITFNQVKNIINSNNN